MREGDRITTGQVVAILSDEEVEQQARVALAEVKVARQEEAQARLDVSVAESRIQEALANLTRAREDTTGRVSQAESNVAAGEAAVEQARAEVTRAGAEVKRAEARLQLARADLDRYRQLFSEGVVSRQQFDRSLRGAGESTGSDRRSTTNSETVGIVPSKKPGERYRAGSSPRTGSRGHERQNVIDRDRSRVDLYASLYSGGRYRENPRRYDGAGVSRSRSRSTPAGPRERGRCPRLVHPGKYLFSKRSGAAGVRGEVGDRTVENYAKPGMPEEVEIDLKGSQESGIGIQEKKR